MKKILSIILALAMIMLMLPINMTAADASVQWLAISDDGHGSSTCTYVGESNSPNSVLISGGDTTYTLNEQWNGTIIVNNADVSYSGNSNHYYILGTGSLDFGNRTLTKGAFDGTYQGSNGSELMSFINGISNEELVPSCTVKNDYTGCGEFYDLTISTGKTLTFPAAIGGNTVGINIYHSINVNGTLSPSDGNILEFCDGATFPSTVLLYKNVSGQPTALNSFEWTDAPNERRTFVYSSTLSKWILQAFTVTTSHSGNGTVTETNSSIANHSNFNVMITPDYGWKIASIDIDGGTANSGNGGSSLNEEEIFQVMQSGGYQFSDITKDHEINITFDINPDAQPFTDFDALKTKVQEFVWAYWGNDITTAAAAKASISATLWDIVSHEYQGAFANAGAATNSVTVTGDGTATVGSIISGLPYYEYSIMIKDNGGTNDVVATGKIYKLVQKQDFILKATKNNVSTYSVKSLSANVGYEPGMSPTADTAFVLDYDSVSFYGVRAEGKTGHTEHSDAFHISGAHDINCQVILYKPDFAGTLATASGEIKHVEAWDFGNYPFVCLNNTTESNPFVLTTYFGYTSITLNTPIDGIALDSITSITTILPDGAITISGLTITFNSDFYDNIPLTITYENNGSSLTSYLTIKRVGIDIQRYRKTENQNILYTLHGTQPGVSLTWENDNNYAIFATYYYPTAQTNRVKLYATLKWADGSTTTKLVEPYNAAIHAANAYFTASDDFLLHISNINQKPVNVSVIAVNVGNSTEFAGATLGSGAGVNWTAPNEV